MHFSEARQSYLAHLIIDTLRGEGLADITNQRLALMEIKRALSQEHIIDARIDAAVRRKIASLSRPIPPGSAEWDVLYRQYFSEEYRKLHRGGA